MPRTLLAANWKMHKTAAATAAFFDVFLEHLRDVPPDADVLIAPPFLSIPAAASRVAGTRILLGAQTMHWELEGPYTGSISAPMLQEFGVTWVILGHSERRAACGETDETVNRKAHTALAQGLMPVIAVGETADERSSGKADHRVVHQTRAALEGIDPDALSRIAIAYEPIWAIGTGNNCDPDEADRMMGAIRNAVAGLRDTPILYGGSMKAANVAAYVAMPNINGGLIGGASLDPLGFADLISRAR
ncbi:MAG TPA: triose-phosphate isomerase [Candidatus Tumulicola sp.]|jgi:triosephosphate isomerase